MVVSASLVVRCANCPGELNCLSVVCLSSSSVVV